jgi:hypothetical protein
VTRRSRITAYGTAVALVLIGAVCAVVISGGTGAVLAMVLIGVGLVGLVSLAFLEIGLSEDRDRDRARARERQRQVRRSPRPAGARRLRPVRPDRRRGQRRRLR